MALFTLFLNRLLWTKKTIFFSILVAGCTLISLGWSNSGYAPRDFFQQVMAPIFLAGLGVFIPMYFGTRAFGEEIESKTISYLLTRPRHRLEYIWQKYLASATASFLMLAPAATISAAILGSKDSHTWSYLPALLWTLALACLAYSAVFLFAGIVFKRPIVFGLMVTFGWENFVSYVPGNFKQLTLMSYIRGFLFRAYEITKMFDQTITEDPPSAALSFLVIGIIILLGLGLAYLFLREKEFAT